jgi:uracil-DNA glycosylase
MTDELLKTLQWYKCQGLDEPMTNHSRKNHNDLLEKITPVDVKRIFKDSDKASSRMLADSCLNLQQLREVVLAFDECLLKKTATNTVFSDGNPDSKVMLIGEAPGANEDIEGIPFCGESGKLLDQIFQSINLSRKHNLYITNSVFWRPPGNRKPTEEEIKTCLPFLEKHIALVNPDLIVAVGAVALSALFSYEGSISKMRKQIMYYSNCYLGKPIRAITIFHPAYLLRQPSQKKTAWEDMLLIKKLLS